MKRLEILAVVLLGVVTQRASADDQPAAGDDTAKPAAQPAAPDPTPAAPTKPAEAPVAGTLPGAKPEPVLAYGMLQRHGISPDLTITGGVRVLHDASDSRWWTARLRAGVLFYAEPTFISLGIAGQFGALDSSALGFEARLFNLWTGIWGQAGVFPIDRVGGVSLEGSIGYGLFSLDYERRVSGPRNHDQTLCLMVEVPLGLLRVVIKPPDGVVMAPKSTTAAR